jgi:hypothetical protein
MGVPKPETKLYEVVKIKELTLLTTSSSSGSTFWAGKDVCTSCSTILLALI